jgi:predicted acylesterase/phospholipase RssA
MTYRVLVLSGGGATGEFQRGVLSVLKRHIDKVDFICGIGVGSLNSAVLAQHDTFAAGVDALEKVWQGIRGNKSLFETPLLGAGLATLGTLIGEESWVANSAYTTKATRALISSQVDWKRLQGKNNWAFGITSLTDACFYTVTNSQELLTKFNSTHPRRIDLSLDAASPHYIGLHLVDLLLAASTVPVFFPPVNLFGQYFCEGGVRDYVPVATAVTVYQLALAKQSGLDVEFIVICNEPGSGTVIPSRKIDSGREILVRMIRIMTREMIDNDISAGKARIRETAGASATWRVIAPTKDLELQPLDFDNLETRGLLRAHGVEVGQATFGV